ncbi:MAG TPA: tyrosine-type recombinase/integrase [Polyangiaceae bacterium]|nr:tyrosine-type recombinase/integrase [Polyangiaceae bacterium]
MLFAEHCQPPRYTRQSARSYVERVTRFIEWAEDQGVHKTDEITLSVLRRFVQARGKEGRGNATINRDLSAIHALLQFVATERRYLMPKLDGGDYASLRVREPRPKPNGVTLSVAQVDAFLAKADAMSSAGYASLLRVTAGSGIRIDEARHLEMSDIDAVAGFLEVNPKKGWTTKGYRARRIPISPATAAAARAFIESRDAVALDNKSVWTEVQRVRKLAELPHFSIHDLRRAWASAVHSRGATLKQISAWLGHSSLQVTERYVRLLADGDTGHAYLPR